jgi:hypothetical protein
MIQGAKEVDRSQEAIERAADGPEEEHAVAEEHSGSEGELESDHWSEKGNIEVFGSDESKSSDFADDGVFKEEHDESWKNT